MKGPRQIQKRDGTMVPFDRRKIERAIQRAAYEVLQDQQRSNRIASSVTDIVIEKILAASKRRAPSVEAVQDIVETA